jgi:hypothetical protein
MDNEANEGVGMRTRQEILDDLRSTVTDMDCTVDEARAVLAIEQVEKLAEKIHVDQLRNDRRARLAEAYILARYSGDAQYTAELNRAIEKMGIEKGRGSQS